MKKVDILLLCLVLAIVSAVGSRLPFSVNPNFMFQEQYGLAYNFAPHLGALCDPDPLKGLEGPTSNVTDQRSLSLLYVVPTKLLRSFVDTYALHRALGLLFFAVTLIGLWGIARALEFSLLATALLLTGVGLSTQLVSYLYESKLTITSAAWFSVALWCIASLERTLTTGQRRGAVKAAVLLPFLLALSYETYTVSRPLAVMLLVFVGFRLCLGDIRGSRLRLIGSFLGSAALAGLTLKLLHPAMRFDQTLFEGRTESLITPAGGLFHAWRETILARISEIPTLFKWSPSYFSSETPAEAGALEIWLVFGVLAFIALLAAARPGATTLREALERNRSFYILVILIAGVAFTIPLFSITHIRGHRLFALFIALPIFIAAIIDALRKSDLKIVRHGSGFAAILIIIALAAHRVPLILAWRPPPHFTFPLSQDTITALKTLPLPDGLSPQPNSVLVRVCDQAQPPSWEHFWNGALYVSDYGCKVGGASTRLSCDCGSREFTDGLQGIVCLTRTSLNGELQLSTHYIPLEGR
ncbi:MAG: hypothetical protein RL417_3 [Pseudomonadota bacterium]